MERYQGSSRDRGLVLLSRINRWLIAGAIGFSGVLSVAAANAFHGHQGSQSSPSRTEGSQSSLQQPAQAPSPAVAPAPSPAVSGGS
jgi:hypothetical protein